MKKQFKKTKSFRPALHVTRYTLRDSHGFTLIEIVVAMAIMSGLAFFFVNLARDTTDATLRFNNQLVTQQQIEQTMQLIVPEIRSIGQGIDGAYPIVGASTSSFQFYSDIDRNGSLDMVRYFLSGTTLKKGVIKPSGSPLAYSSSSEALTDVVTNVVAGTQIFSYYDSSATSSLSNALPTPVDVLKIKTVKMTVVANQGTPGKPSLAGAETSATIRNLRYK
jgi:prepilin-type N-terminal cleavage/methylation domain-containing protein